jgi:two-component system, cell cycle response regulator
VVSREREMKATSNAHESKTPKRRRRATGLLVPKKLGPVVTVLPAGEDGERIRALIESQGHEVIELSRERDPIESVRALEPRVLLIDSECQDVEAFRLCRQLKKSLNGQKMSVVLLLPHRDETEIAAALAAGASDFLIKPVERQELQVRLASQLGAQEMLAELSRHRHGQRALLDVYRAISATLDSDRVLTTIVRKVAVVMGASRVSILLIDRPRDVAYVIATHEDPLVRDLMIELAKYPEIRRVIETRDAIAIDDLANDPLMESVRKYVRQFEHVSVLVVPIIWEEEVLGTLFLRAARVGRPFAPEEIDFCRLVAQASLNAIRNARTHRALLDEKKRLEVLAITDQLTSTYNHSYLYVRLQEEFQRAQRYSLAFSYIMFDIDNFKRINDTYGHMVGDRLLRELTDEVRRVIRKSDLLARYGGEEFAILLPSTGMSGALREGERVCEAVARLRFTDLPASECLTVSVGVASFPDASVSNSHDLIVNADRALYRAKAEGKNRVCKFH